MDMLCMDRRIAPFLSIAMWMLACGASRSPAVKAPAAPPPEAASSATQPISSTHPDLDFSVVSKWHLCEKDDLGDCTLQCNRGHLPSCVRLGNIYLDGKLVPTDMAVAAQAYELPCDSHMGAACFNIGLIYARKNDMGQAAAYYDRACKEGEPTGCAYLADSYADGTGVTRDPARAAGLYDRACQAGELRSCSRLGTLYALGTGVVKNGATAVRLFEKACSGGNAGGCGNLGSSYKIGLGVPRDSRRAAQLYKQACDAGAKAYCDLVERR